MPSLEKDIVLKNKYGLHARPATLLADTANRFQAEIAVSKDGADEVDAKSIFNLMMLAAECGSTLRFRASGDDAEGALLAIEKVIDGKFNEE